MTHLDACFKNFLERRILFHKLCNILRIHDEIRDVADRQGVGCEVKQIPFGDEELRRGYIKIAGALWVFICGCLFVLTGL